MRLLLCSLAVVAPTFFLWGEEGIPVEISKSDTGTMRLTVAGKADHYYILYRSQDLADPGEIAELALGSDGPLVLKDRFAPLLSQVYYRVREVHRDAQEDIDGDGRYDFNELRANIFKPDEPRGNALNSVDKLRGDHGSDLLTRADFEAYSVNGLDGRGQITPGLIGERFMKFIGLPLHDPTPAVLFMNSQRYGPHRDFLAYMSGKGLLPLVAQHGELAWVPNVDVEGDGWYLFDLQGQLLTLEEVRVLYQTLTKNMPFVDGNLAYRPWGPSLALYLNNHLLQEQLKLEGIPVWLDNKVTYPDLFSYTTLNEGETYGLLRVFDGDERPTLLDVAIYRQLPNDVPLLRGIITESPQTPLSHVNLRAVQNHNPNAFIAEASSHPAIEPLIGKYVRYAVRAYGFEIEESTQEEVNAHLAALRPKETQEPPRELLGNRSIQQLTELGFDDANSVGAKAANLAEMISAADEIGIPRKVLPDSAYAVPFYFYDEFMTHNGLYETARAMMASPGFAEDAAVRAEALDDFRKRFKKGSMPNWMLDALSEVQKEFQNVDGIRCRSSTNNEDLPGFNGAGLYDSYTHYPDEGHLSKTIRQVYASLWTFIAFEHREFYRVDHFKAAMGVLMHANYQDEKANGVAVSQYDLLASPVSSANDFYYANVQVGEDLVTNPELDSRPEELLLHPPIITRGFLGPTRPIRLGNSNQVPAGTQLLGDDEGTLLGSYLFAIVNHFRPLYGGSDDFAMEIEFKIDRDGQLIIKQARPWVE